MIIKLEELTEREILGLTIIGEARGEPIEGQVAVGNIVRNRVRKSKKTYQNICLAPLQFSCWNHDDPNRAFLVTLAERLFDGQQITDPYLRQCMFIAQGIVDDIILDNTLGAENYMTQSLFYSDKRPKWARKTINHKLYGKQIFFTALRV